MKSLQVIDPSEDCPYNVYSVQDDVFRKIFGEGTNVEFYERFVDRCGREEAGRIIQIVQAGRVDKTQVVGIHGLFFFRMSDRSKYYPTNRFDEVGAGY